MLIWTNFDSFAVAYLIQVVDCFKNFIFQQRWCLQFFANKKGPGTTFPAAFFVEFVDEITSLEYDINRPNFINRLCLLPTLSSKMYFLFHAQVFDDFMKFENRKF